MVATQPNTFRRVVFASAVFLAGAGQAAWAQCEKSSSTTELYDAVELAQRQFTNLEIGPFKETTESTRALLPCLGEPVPRHLAAELHRLYGLDAVVDKKSEVARLAFAAARSIEPDYRFPTEMVPASSPVMAEYNAIPLVVASAEPVPVPLDGSLQFDGRPGSERPTGFPTLVQVMDGAGAVKATAYLGPKDPMPAYEAKAVSSKPVTGGEGPTDRRRPIPLLVAAGSVAVTSGILYGAAVATEHKYWDEDTPDSELPRLRSQTNGLVASSAIGAMVATGLGVVVVLRW